MIASLLRWLIRQLLKLLNILDPMADLAPLTAQVDRTVTLEAAAVAALGTIPPDQQAAIDELTAKLTTSNDALQAALTPAPTP